MMDKLKQVPVLNMMIPSNPILTVERDATGNALRYCLDADTEKYLQRQRMFAMIVGGPTVMYAGWKMNAPWWQRLGVASLGAACTIHHYYSWKTVREAEQV